MESPSYLEVYPDAVMRAGQQTTDTAGAWQTWSTRIRMHVGHTDNAVRSTHISAALDVLAERVVPVAARVGQRVADLGVVTTSAGVVVADSDGVSAELLHQQSGAAAGQASVLSRPIDGSAAAV
ncbi:hypothetical protein JQS43_23015 [Natronosporangium hydrolyticum]|uniref:Uncharacterized protein n=1 Tax=Natronosporangium hydrolyticum TaxID=2811111 RepID=A0A895YG00_9ACTN|nr:hypothetical protein [Natronosporangium hydrolyticum]QSB14333.1 hypothetical protein JQS43_23015 [Natronosporangium hydrolyticum]